LPAKIETRWLAGTYNSFYNNRWPILATKKWQVSKPPFKVNLIIKPKWTISVPACQLLLLQIKFIFTHHLGDGEDGYHELQTLFPNLSIYLRHALIFRLLEIPTSSSHLLLSQLPTEENLIYKAAGTATPFKQKPSRWRRLLSKKNNYLMVEGIGGGSPMPPRLCWL